jgi:hypothetical protein
LHCIATWSDANVVFAIEWTGAMLGGVDLRGWDDESDLVRAEIRLLPVVHRFTSEPDVIQASLGKDLSRRLRAFNDGQDLDVSALRALHADLLAANRSAAPEATIDKILPVEWR